MEQWLVEIVHKLGYLGIFIATLIESTFVPIPAEVTMIPAGMLAFKGELNYWIVMVSATLGTLAGSIINYVLGIRYGRVLVLKYGRYLMLKPEFLHKTELFFAKYGAWAVLIGRMLPGIKHYIAFVAGVAVMRFSTFVVFTGIGSLIWMWILLQIGYMAEKSNEGGHSTLSSIEMIVIVLVVITAAGWWIIRRMMRH